MGRKTIYLAIEKIVGGLYQASGDLSNFLTVRLVMRLVSHKNAKPGREIAFGNLLLRRVHQPLPPRNFALH